MLAERRANFESLQRQIIRLRVDAPKAIGVLLLCMNAMLKLFRNALLIILVLIGAAWVWGEGYQWLLRWRAEQLLSDVRSLEINRSGWSDAQRVMARWSQWGKSSVTCTADACAYQINVIQSLPPTLGGYPDKGVKNWLPKMMGHLGLRGAAARGAFAVQHGVVTEKGFGEQVTLPVGDWDPTLTYVPYLTVSSHTSFKFHERAGEFPHLHPNRMVQTYPHGMNVSFAPDEDPSEQALLMDFRFSCVTQLRPCQSEGEILPEGWRMVQEQHSAATR